MNESGPDGEGIVIRTFAIVAMTGALAAGMAPAALAGEAAVAVTDGATPELLRFDTASPGALVARMPVVGLLFGEQIEAIDQRPATGSVVAVTSVGRVLVVDPATGIATFAGAPLGSFVTPPGLGSDFNPTVDRLRVTSAGAQNGRWNPLTQTVVDGDGNPANGDTADTALAFATGDPHQLAAPDVADIAYANNDTDAATPTTAYAIDAGVDALARLGGPNGTPSPNGGQLSTLGALGVNIDDGALDIATPAAGNVAYAALHLPADTASKLYRVNLATGAATLVGPIGGGGKVDAFTVLRGGALRVAAATVAESGTAAVAVTRTGDTLAPVQVGYRTVGHTALSGVDYTDVRGTLAFAQGQRTASIAVPIKPDVLDEPDETFSVELGAPAGGAVVDTPSTPIAIRGDDRKPVFLAAPTAPDTLRALGKAKSLKLVYACSEACVAQFSLKLGPKTIGTALASRSSAGLGKAAVRLSNAGKKTVASAAKRRGSTTLTLAATVRDLAGNTVTSTTRIKVRRR